MRSNVCKIENGTRDLAMILKESEKVAAYNALDQKQTLQLRLLCEELDGMLPKIVDEFDGALWIDFEDGVCKIHLSIQFAEFSMKKKKEMIAVAKDKKNAATKGIVAKIGAAIEEFFLNPDNFQPFNMTSGLYGAAVGYGIEGPCQWTLEEYKATVKKAKKAEAWDELEKSVLASLADDVIVGVKGLNAEVVIVKKFA